MLRFASSLPLNWEYNGVTRCLGAKTKRHTRENYLNEWQFERYGFVLVIGGSRFAQGDLRLAQSLIDMGKHFFFVRSKIDDA